MSDLISALEAEETLRDRGGAVPPRALQIAHLIAAEATRLIRLGTRVELTEAAAALSRALIGPAAERLKDLHPEAYRVVSGIAVALSAATAPSSSGGELTVLRSWNGNASRVLGKLRSAPDQRMMRSELRRELDLDQSYLSHLLSDLEAASLIVRIREGREVTVFLGPTARSKHVEQFLRGVADDIDDDCLLPAGAGAVRQLFEEILAGGSSKTNSPADIARMLMRKTVGVRGRSNLERQVNELRQRYNFTDTSVDVEVATDKHVICRVRFAGTAFGHADWAGAAELCQLWAARTEGGEPVEVEAWAPLASLLDSLSQRPAWSDAAERYRVVTVASHHAHTIDRSRDFQPQALEWITQGTSHGVTVGEHMDAYVTTFLKYPHAQRDEPDDDFLDESFGIPDMPALNS